MTRPFFSAEIVGEKQLKVESLNITEQLGNHTVVTIHAKDSYNYFETGQPMQIAWSNGKGSDVRYLVGYLNHVRKSERSDSSDLLIYMIGGSWPLKDAHKRTWNNFYISDILKDIVAEHRLNYFIDSFPDHITIGQSGETDWQFLNGLASKYGRILATYGTSILFIDPDNVIKSPLSNGQAVDVKLSRISPDVGSMSPRGMANGRIISSSLDNSGNLITAEAHNQPSWSSLSKRVETSPFTSYQESSSKSLYDITSESTTFGLDHVWGVSAKAIVLGQPNLTAGRVIFVSSSKGDDVNGLWAIKKANHVINSTESYVELEIGRDGYGVQVPIRPLDGGVSYTYGAGIAPPRLLKGKWVASWNS